MIRDPRKLSDNRFDLLIVGGGIHGACAARSAAARGLSVALVERDDFGAHTSHNSLKIVHGGLRYLQHADFARTRESVRARSAWLREAPHLVRPLGFLMPLYGWVSRGPAALWAAMRVHELIGRDRNRGVPASRHIPPGRILSAADVTRMLPGLDGSRLAGGAIWYDGHMLDADRLLMVCLEDAAQHGAVVCNYMTAERIDVANDRVRGVELVDTLSGERLFAEARHVINAAGPWAGAVAAALSTGPIEVATSHTKNMNLVVPEVLPNLAFGVKSRRRSDSLFDVSNRLFFITPWRGMSVIGTTHVAYDGTPDQYRIEDSDVEGFIDEINAAYPLDLKPEDVTYGYGGLTPADEGRLHGEARRSHRGSLVDHGERDGVTGLWSLIGVKYTTAQLTADTAVDAVLASLGRTARARDLAATLPGGEDFTSEADLAASLARRVDRAVTDPELVHFAATFGSEAEKALVEGAWGADDGDDALFRCRVRYAVRAECALRLEDVLLRRTDRLARGRLSTADVDWAADFMAAALGWSTERRAAETGAAGDAIVRQRGRLLPATGSRARSRAVGG